MLAFLSWLAHCNERTYNIQYDWLSELRDMDLTIKEFKYYFDQMKTITYDQTFWELVFFRKIMEPEFKKHKSS